MKTSTPFFEAFGPLLFGKAPKSALAEMRRVDSLERLYGLFGDLIPQKLFEPSDKGANSRQRRLPPKVIFWAFVSQVLSPGASCRDAVRKVEAWWRWAGKGSGDGLTTSAYCQARRRLDIEGLRVIADQIAWTLERHVHSEEGWIKGRSVKIIDGTTVSMPDTAENQQAWPQPGSQKPGLGFPLLKVVGLFSLASGRSNGEVSPCIRAFLKAIFT